LSPGTFDFSEQRLLNPKLFFGSILLIHLLGKMVLEFPHSVEILYKASLAFNVAITIPSHLLMIVLAQFCTPKEMKAYKYNVTNTTVWSILFTIHTMIFFRPMPLFPLPAAKILGDFCNLGDYYGGHIQFMIMVILISNVVCEFRSGRTSFFCFPLEF
jgi:hypothetical protein